MTPAFASLCRRQDDLAVCTSTWKIRCCGVLRCHAPSQLSLIPNHGTFTAWMMS